MTGLSTRGTKITAALSLGLVLAAVVALFLPLRRGMALMLRDLLYWVIPSRGLVRDALRHGALPAWNPWEGLGFAPAADPLFMPFYPPNVLTLPLPLAWGTSLLLGLHTLLGAAGSFALARRFGVSPPAAAVAGLAWGLAGLSGSMIPTGTLLLPAAWIPVICCAAHGLGASVRQARPPWRAALALGLSGAMILLTGEVFVTLMAAFPALACLGAAASLPADPADPTDPAARRARARLIVLGLGLSAGVALLLSAPSWLPAVRLVGSTPRARPLAATLLDQWSLHPVTLLDLLVSRGVFDAAIRTGRAEWLRFVDDKVLFVTIYLGATVLGLAALGPTRRPPRTAALVLSVAGFGVLLALGRYLPVLGLVRAVLRPFAFMRSPIKFLLIAQPMVALAAALGAERVLRGAPPWRRLGVMGGLLGVGGIVGVSGTLPLGPGMSAVLGLGMLGALVRLGLLAAAVGAVQLWGPRAALALPLAVALDLGPHAALILAWEDPSPYTRPPPMAEALRALGAATRRGQAPPRLWRSERLVDPRPGALGPVNQHLHDTLRPKLNLPWGVAVVNGYDAAIGPEVDTLTNSARVAALRLLSVDAVLLAGTSAPPGTRPLPSPVSRASLYALDAPLPRSFVAYAARPAPTPAQGLRALLDEEILRGDLVALDPGSLDVLPERAPRPPSPCTITAWAPGSVSLRCAAASAGLAVLVEQWTPGWEATVDGRPAAVIAVNRMMLGTPVPAGGHTVRLRFRTPGQGAGLGLAGLGVALVLALWAWSRRTPVP